MWVSCEVLEADDHGPNSALKKDEEEDEWYDTRCPVVDLRTSTLDSKSSSLTEIDTWLRVSEREARCVWWRGLWSKAANTGGKYTSGVFC